MKSARFGDGGLGESEFGEQSGGGTIFLLGIKRGRNPWFGQVAASLLFKNRRLCGQSSGGLIIF
ncbi:MAG: hypothetical protein N3G20_09495 [Verrucomicrobiae bacterium]|nr:hypothetical protein [Verrucomicrobiae bacterium]